MKALKKKIKKKTLSGGAFWGEKKKKKQPKNKTHNNKKALFGFKSRCPGFGFERATIGPTVPFRFKGFWTLGCCLPGQK